MAGQTPTRPLGAVEAAVVMTGAPLPAGCDAVVMHERTHPARAMRPDRRPGGPRPAKFLLARAARCRAGDVVLRRGRSSTPARLGVLASVGRSEALGRPTAHGSWSSPTGDELVEPGQRPGPGPDPQLERGDAPGPGTRTGPRPSALPIAPDDAGRLRAALEHGLEADVLLITGGVSAGQRDLVPETLERLGVRGSSIRSGSSRASRSGSASVARGAGSERSTAAAGPLVFGLPGNPVSGLVGFLLFVRPALAVLARHRPVAVESVAARLRGRSGTGRPADLLPGAAVLGADERTAGDRDPRLGRLGRPADRGPGRRLRRFPAGDRDTGRVKLSVSWSLVISPRSLVIGGWVVCRVILASPPGRVPTKCPLEDEGLTDG